MGGILKIKSNFLHKAKVAERNIASRSGGGLLEEDITGSSSTIGSKLSYSQNKQNCY